VIYTHHMNLLEEIISVEKMKYLLVELKLGEGNLFFSLFNITIFK